MPTVLRMGGFSFRFYSNDHEPAHVHCKNGDGIVIVEIATGHVVDQFGEIRKADVLRAVSMVAEHRDHLHREWREFAIRRGARR
jgi:hypothetical protein